MTRNQSFDQSYYLSGKMDDRKSYSTFVEKVRKVTCCKKNKSRSLERSKREDLLNKLKNLRPKYAPEVFTDDDNSTTEFSSRKIVNPKEMSYLYERKSNSRGQRSKMSIGNRRKVSYNERPLCSRRNEVCYRSDESSRSSNKMHCYCYGESQGKHYSRNFEKFQYGTEVTSLEAMSSSLDTPPTRIKKEKLKSSFSTHKKRPCEKRTNRNCSNLSCQSLVVNLSPGTNIDYLSNDKIKNRRNLNKNSFQDFSHCQCSSESSGQDDFEKKSKRFPKNQKEILDEGKIICDKAPEDERFDCCCGDEEKVKAGSPYFCRCPGYKVDPYFSGNSIDFQSKSTQWKNKDAKYKESEEDDNYTEEDADDEEDKGYNCRSLVCEECKDEHVFQNNDNQNNSRSDFRRKVKSTNNIRLEDLTPDLPLPNHWTKCGEHLTEIANEYRRLSDKLKSMQSLAEDQSSNKTTKKKFTRIYPSGKKFTFKVKPANDASFQKSKGSRCECKECPLLLKTWKNIKSWGNGKESQILKSYNALTNSKNVVNTSLNQKMFGEPSQGSIKDQEAFVFSPRGKVINPRSTNCCKDLKKREINLQKMKSDHDRCDCENKIVKDKMLKVPKNKKRTESNINFPRIVKPGGHSCKVNLGKILIYPPHGEEGPPLTLYKKFSNIDCRITGDATKGFRYKVSYKQKFLSPIWHPEDGASPFRKKENTTDYG